jgi:hypothetical protein
MYKVWQVYRLVREGHGVIMVEHGVGFPQDFLAEDFVRQALRVAPFESFVILQVLRGE